MKKSAQQEGFVDPKIIIGGIIVLVAIFFIATGKFNFSASVKPNSNQPSDKQEQTATPQPQSKPKTYQNEAKGISLDYPASWSLKENPTKDFIAVFSSPKEGNNDSYSEGLGLRVVDTSSKPSVALQEIADLWENQTKQAESTFVVTDRKDSTIAGETAKEIVYNFKDNQASAKGMTRITLKNKKAYIFQYNAMANAYDKYLSDIEGILTSVKF